MERDIPREESLSPGQELLNRIYSTFLSFPTTDVDVELIDKNKADTQDNRKLIANKFSYHFPEGTTTPGFSDQLSAKYTLKDQKFDIFYAKGVFATKITLKKNLETDNVDLVG